MPNALQNPQHDDYPDDTSHGRFGEIEAIARETESQCRTWDWLRDLSARNLDRRVIAILYPSTMAGAASLVHRLESAGIPWQTLDRTFAQGGVDPRDAVAISLRVVDERLIFDGVRIRAHAGYSASALAYAAAARGLLGLEFLAEVGGSLGAVLRRGYEGDVWRVIDEILIARHGSLKVILTRGAVLSKEQRVLAEGGLILAATLRLFKREREDSFTDQLYAGTGMAGDQSEIRLNESPMPGGELIPLTDRLRERALAGSDLELENNVDAWRNDAEER